MSVMGIFRERRSLRRTGPDGATRWPDYFLSLIIRRGGLLTLVDGDVVFFSKNRPGCVHGRRWAGLEVRIDLGALFTIAPFAGDKVFAVVGVATDTAGDVVCGSSRPARLRAQRMITQRRKDAKGSLLRAFASLRDHCSSEILDGVSVVRRRSRAGI